MTSSKYASWASSKRARNVMVGNRSRDTRPELALRSALHGLGLRYRVGTRPVDNLRRTADIVFRKARVAVFVDGCYWHGCPEHYSPASTNADYWIPKIEHNKRRDAETDTILRRAGWTPLRIWEHEAVDDAVERVVSALAAHPSGGDPHSASRLRPRPGPPSEPSDSS